MAAPPKAPQAPATWGWMLQLYALRSARSWGIGDLGDLREFVNWTASEHGSGAVLLNPLHAPGPTHPVQPSPYTPSSRRFANPLALRIEDIDSYRRTDPDTRAEVDGPSVSEGLRDWATYCALAERHRGRWSRWPEPLRDVAAPAVASARQELAPRLAFHAWVQQRCVEQLNAVRDAARESGMGLGVLHDLAVGVDADGADAWALADVLATGVSIGAPPDNFTPRGQDWGLPPWRPDRLAANGYGALRDMLRAVLAHADGLRIDHVAGLWRLWWIPPGDGPDRGTYVHSTPTSCSPCSRWKHTGPGPRWSVRTWAPSSLRSPKRWPTTACSCARCPGSPATSRRPGSRSSGRRRGRRGRPPASRRTTFPLRRDSCVENTCGRADLGLLDDVPAEKANADRERAEWLALLRSEGLLPADDGTSSLDDPAIIAAMHRFLASTPSHLKLISPYDVIAEPRQPNLPGTVDEYPNWRLPLPETLEQLRDDPRVAEITAAFRAARTRDAS